MLCIGKHNSWRRRKVKLEKGAIQSVQQAKPSMHNATMHHTQTAVGTIGTVLE
jgi:hypothetical protein